MKKLFLILCALFMGLPSTLLWAHARLDTEGIVPPRSANAGIKTGPCGTDVASTPTPFHAGSTIVVSWVETIDHPGEYRFSFSAANDENFKPLKTVEDLQDDGVTPHYYSTTITLPSEPCSQCTLQLIQVMTDRNPPTNYYSCADISIIPVDQPLPGGGGTPIPNNLNLAQKCSVMIDDFTSFDADSDFQLSFTEVENTMNFLDNTEFTQVDQNGDGYLQMSELQAVGNPPTNNSPAANNNMAGAWNPLLLFLLVLLFGFRKVPSTGNGR